MEIQTVRKDRKLDPHGCVEKIIHLLAALHFGKIKKVINFKTIQDFYQHGTPLAF